ncbi:class I SAM-dependent DNA methyltransferase [Halalkalibacter oceani]|uniref:class I SAM-dependent DNA methyltransferase n=1 Tax=Halalkalibacter oceani TaxID=1653776 RepID=UPI00339AC9E3
MSYQVFATLYDQLMKEAPYDEWLAYVKRQLGDGQLANKAVMDVGCGTGELLIRLALEGAQVTGVDLSAEMLAIANEKCEKAGVRATLLEQSMTGLVSEESYDLITIFCDSLNYLELESDVQATFESAYNRLHTGGLLLFDVHSVHKIEEGYIGQTFADDEGDIAYIWTAFPGEHQASVEHELTFFIQDQPPYYIKKEELHKQRTFAIRQYEAWLAAAGFTVESITADFKEAPPHEGSERIFFCAKK